MSYCKIHNSPIGGVCSDINCPSTVMCMQCVASSNSCVRTKNHQFVPLDEFIDTYFDKEYHECKSNASYSTNTNTIEDICKNCQNIVDNFHAENEKIGSVLIDTFKTFIDKINQLFVQFNQNHINFIQQKEAELTASLTNLLKRTNYDLLEGFNKEQFALKLKAMKGVETLNTTIRAMKDTIKVLRTEELVRDIETVKELTKIKSDKVLSYFDNEFKNLTAEAEKRYNLYSTTIKTEMFAENESSKQNLSEYDVIYDDTIDFTANSNFLTKKFAIFEHSNGNTLLAYPTSQNTIKLEYFDKIIADPTPTIKPNSNMYVTAKANARDKYLYFTLQSHSAKINDIIYYRSSDNKDYVLSSSDDCTIKIWDITSLNAYLKNVNDYYRANCIKTLIGHQGIIVSTKVFFDPLKSINYIVSLGYNDKIKVWDLVKGQFVRDIVDPNVNRGTYDNLMTIANVNKSNVLITANSTRRLIKIWDFDRGEVQRVLNYESTFKIVNITYFGDINKVIIVDDCGECGVMEVKEDVSKMRIMSAKFEKCGVNEARLGCFKWEGDIIGTYSKNGMVSLFDVTNGKFIDKKVMAKTFISCATAYMHHTKKRIVVVHSGDMHLKIFN